MNTFYSSFYFCFVIVFAEVSTRELTDDEYHSLPKLFHLDDYERCLGRSRGVYCQGTFHVGAGDQPSSTLQLMEAYSSNPQHFNHSLLHRGYCVSSRCPSLPRSLDPSVRFARCAARWGKRYSLRLRLCKLHYCTTQGEGWTMGASHLLFLCVVGVILLMNVVGTAYHGIMGDRAKNKLVSAWSVPCNWKLMTLTLEGKEQATLAPLQGFRVTTFIVITSAHALMSMPRGFLANPRTFTHIVNSPMGSSLMAGLVMAQIYLLLSSFLAAYHLLLKCQREAPGLAILPKLLLRRFIRMGPTTLLMVSFASTWWPRLGDGPQWRSLVGAESDTCRRKYWTHLLFLNNLLEPGEYCITPTWFLAADMQLYLFSTSLALLLAQRRVHALKILTVLYVISTFMITALAYVMEWKAVIFEPYPEHARTLGRQSSQLPFFMSPGGGVQACLCGVALAFVQLKIREQGGFKSEHYKWLVYAFNAYVPLTVAWTQVSFLLNGFQNKLLEAVFFGLERPIAMIFSVLIVFGSINIDSAVRRLFSWRGWAAPARASLPYMLVHWILLTSIAAGRVHPLHFTLFEHAMESVTACFLGYAIAIPISLLAEIPLQRAMGALLL